MRTKCSDTEKPCPTGYRCLDSDGGMYCIPFDQEELSGEHEGSVPEDGGAELQDSRREEPALEPLNADDGFPKEDVGKTEPETPADDGGAKDSGGAEDIGIGPDEAGTDNGAEPDPGIDAGPCGNGIRDNDETDVDCGGSCPPCDNGLACESHTDCLSGLCFVGRCASAGSSCVDGAQNGLETGVDCGGLCGPCDACDDPFGASGVCRCEFVNYSPLPDSETISSLAALSDQEIWMIGGSRLIRLCEDREYIGHIPSATIMYNRVFGSGPDDVWIAGYNPRDLWHWDGSEWQFQPAFFNFQIYGAFALDPQNAWVGGYSDQLMHFNGTSWSPVNLKTSVNIHSIWASSPEDVWVGGAAGKLLHSNGPNWESVDSLTTQTITGIWGISSSDLWLTGSETEGNVLHYNGTNVEEVTTGSAYWLTSVHGSSSSNVWFVGAGDAAVQFDGLGFNIENHLGWYANAVAVTSSRVVVAGDVGRLSYREADAWRNHFLLDDSFFEDAWGDSSGELWIAGNTRFTAGHWNGSGWEKLPNLGGHAVFGFSANDLWFAENQFYHRVNQTTLVYPTKNNTLILGLWGSAPDNLWAVGAGGLIENWNGTSWEEVTSPTTQTLNAIQGFSENDIWAVGSAGVMIHYQGTQWELVTSPTTLGIEDLWMERSDSIWLAGAEGVYHGTGAAWTQELTLPGYAVAGSATGDVWAALSYPTTLWRFNGSVWRQVQGPQCGKQNTRALWVSADGTDVWAFGQFGSILRWVGSP